MFLITITRLSQDLREPIRRKEQTWLSIPGTVVFIMCFHSVSEYKRQMRRVKMFLTASQGSTGGDTSTLKPIRSKGWVKNYVTQTWVYIYTVITLISTHILNRNKDFSHCTLQFFIGHISCNANVLYDLNHHNGIAWNLSPNPRESTAVGLTEYFSSRLVAVTHV
jgi:hypothetical protein